MAAPTVSLRPWARPVLLSWLESRAMSHHPRSGGGAPWARWPITVGTKTASRTLCPPNTAEALHLPRVRGPDSWRVGEQGEPGAHDAPWCCRGAVAEGPRRGRLASASSPPPQLEHSQTRQAAVWARWDRAGQSEAFPAGRREGCCGTYDAGCDHTLMTRSRRCRRTWISSKRRRID